MKIDHQILHVYDGSGASSIVLPSVYSFTVEELLSVVIAEVGYVEKETEYQLDDKTENAGNENYTKYSRDLYTAGYYDRNNQGCAWCDMFVDWCFLKLVSNKTGMSLTDCRETAEMLICQTNTTSGSGCKYSMSYYEKANRLGSLPVAGAQVFFMFEGEVSHTGIVTGYTDSLIYTVEGDSTDKVSQHQYRRTDSSICGYGYPRLEGLSIPTAASALSVSFTSQPTYTTSVDQTFNGLKYSDRNPPLYCPQTQSTCYRGTKEMTVRGILWHDTGAGNTELRRYVQPSDNASDRARWLSLLGKNKYNNDWNHIEHRAGVNGWIGKLADGTVTTVQAMPWNWKPWGCGTAYSGGASCNDGWIQFEICDDFGHGDSEQYFRKAYNEACQLTAYLCTKFNLDPKGSVEYKGKQVPVILDHRTAHKLGLGSNHGDVRNWFKKYGKYDDDDGMRIVREDVSALLSSGTSDTPIIKTNDVVTVNQGAISLSGERALSYVTNYSWIVSESSDGAEYAKIGSRTDGARILDEYYKKSDLTVVSATGSSSSSSPSSGNLQNDESIWNLLCDKVKNSTGKTNYYGVAGIMGNMYCESGYKPKNLQNSYEKRLTGLTGTAADNAYTVSVDNGSYTNFVRDGAGYGLVQWTYWSLKEGLLKYAQNHNKSIGDLEMQVEFLCYQLSTSYKSVWNTCCNAKSIKEASDKVLHDFERPAGHDSYNKESQERGRATAGQDAYNRFYGGCTHESTVLSDATPASCVSDGYSGDEVCSSCGLIVKFGTRIPATGHSYDSTGKCIVCGKTSTEDFVTSDGELLTREDLQKMLAILKDMLLRES